MTPSRKTRARLGRRILCTGEAHALLVHRGRLPLEAGYAEEVAALRAKYPALGQVMALENHGGAPALARLVGLLWAEIAALCLDALLIAVDPGDASFYRRLGFRPTGWPRRHWLLADDAEVEALVLDVAEARCHAADALARLRATDAAGQPVKERQGHD